jgi:hypothetical protein
MLASILISLAVGGALQSMAQTTGTMYGSVTDQTGAVIVGANVTAKNTATGLERTAPTGPDGNYVLTLIPVGNYTISVSKPGYQQDVGKDARLLLNQNLRLNFELRVGTVTQKIEVTIDPAQVDLQSASLGQVELGKTIQELPLSGRNYLQIAQLQPGVNPPIPGTATLATPATPGGTAFSPQGNGVRPYDNLVLVDGIYNIEPSLNTVMLVPNPDSLEELKVYTGNYAAEFGGAGGVVSNVVTRSGTNALHGSAYIFERNAVLDARDFFAPVREPRRRHEFGFVLSGPLRKDQSFWTASYQGIRDHLQKVSIASVPSMLERNGDFSQSSTPPIDPTTGAPFRGNMIPSNRIDPVAAAIVNSGLFAPANAGQNTWSGLLNAPTRGDQFLARVDHRFSSKDSLAIRSLFEDFDIAQPIQPYAIFGTIATPGFAVADTARFQNYAIIETHVFNPGLLNELKFAYIRAALGFNKEVDKVNARDFGFTFPVTFGFPAFPQVGVAGFNPIGLNDSAETTRIDNMFQVEESVSYTTGRHQTRFGASLRRIQMNSYSPITFAGAYGFFGVFTGNSMADFLLGAPLLFFQGGGQFDRYFRTTYLSPYAEDTIRLTPRLTLNLGLRYDLFTPPTEKKNRMSTLVPGQQSKLHPDVPVGVLFAGDPGIPKGIYHLDTNNFAPRIGLAWDPTGSGKTSVRASYGIFYSAPILYSNIDGTDVPTVYAIATGVGTPFADPWSGASPFRGGPIPGVLPNGFGQNDAGWMPDVVTPYYQHWNLNIQRQVADFIVQLAYVGTAGHHLVGFISPTQAKLFVPGVPNTPATIAERSPIPGILLSDNASTKYNSIYHGFQASVNKRYSRGISFSASYTFSKMIDDNSAANRFQVLPGAPLYPQDSTNLKAERGLSNYDIRHRFVASFNWSLPEFRGHSAPAQKLLGGWQLNGIIAAQSGRPFTVIDPTDPQSVGEFFSRPDMIKDPNLPPDQRTPERWFDTSAFVKVPFGTPRFGNEPRNVLAGPGLANVDFSIFKNTKIRERVTAQFRVEFFNLFNRANFQVPVNDITSPLFGQVISTATPPRNIQMAFRLSF